ncbi:MAG: hypothetical protein A3H29_13705 [Acidobacteria bacterium RIFCSPLOWO2_02_FULL_67_21]|nr:MAG: hypothetical protein A3H29_13705 [Acidobacteria bacterium RIFCSPLOWO2_02_FULL_67_21]
MGPLAGQAPARPQVPVPGQFPAYTPPLAADKRPDLNGIWQAFVTANIDIQDHDAQPGPRPEIMGAYGAWPAGQGIVEGGEIPYRPEALAKKKENVANRMKVEIHSDSRRHDTGDPELKCYRAGLPRAVYMPFPFQIVQSQDKIVILHEYANALRIINMTNPSEAPAESWMGWSNGKWDGNSLVIDTSGFVPYTWFDRAGNYHSDALKVTERFTPVSPYHMMYEATIDDAKVFTRPWKVSFPLYRRMERNVQLLDFNCVPFTEDLLYDHLRKERKFPPQE